MKTITDERPTRLLPLDVGMPREQLMQNLRMNALLSHQRSVGHGDDIIEILKNAISQMETTHRRVQNMNMILFGVGLVMLGFGIVFVFRGQEAWGTLISGTGGIASLAATFWTAPLEKMSRSVRDLVQLEAAFLGYIRVIGEVDSSFQMRYLDILNGGEQDLETVTHDTVEKMKDIMTHTLVLIETIGNQSRSSQELKKRIDDLSTHPKN